MQQLKTTLFAGFHSPFYIGAILNDPRALWVLSSCDIFAYSNWPFCDQPWVTFFPVFFHWSSKQISTWISTENTHNLLSWMSTYKFLGYFVEDARLHSGSWKNDFLCGVLAETCAKRPCKTTTRAQTVMNSIDFPLILQLHWHFIVNGSLIE